MSESFLTVDGNEATAAIAHCLSEVIAIYPITPASPMGELADAWSTAGRPNLWGHVPDVVEMQSEGGAAGAVHGAIQAGALTTTFTASQGLLLMLPNFYKLAGELTPAVIHVAARSIATHALSIFGDHSDVMAARQTGMALLASSSVQEAHDLALVAHVATLASRVPFIHFFDGFRTSHEINKIAVIDEEAIRALVRDDDVTAHRTRGLDPNRPVVRGTAQNPDVFFQAREAANPFHDAVAGVVQATFDQLFDATGRSYRLFDYWGAPDAERVIVIMGSGLGTARQVVERAVADGEKIGVVGVRLYRPFETAAFDAAVPSSVQSIAVLDRTKEPGTTGEPLYLDVVAAMNRHRPQSMPTIVGGRYGLGSKEFTPPMVQAVFAALRQDSPPQEFTVGITDDVTGLSLPTSDSSWDESEDITRAVFYGLGSDGTVGANKNSVKIISTLPGRYGQGYFVYDSKKAGSTTESHLRFGPRPIDAPYLIDQATFVACHDFGFLDRIDVLERAAPGATVLLNSPYSAAEVWDRLPIDFQRSVVERGIDLWVVDANRVASDAGLGRRVNTVLQTCFFHLSGVLPAEEAIEAIKHAIEASYAKRGAMVLARNYDAVDAAVDALERVAVPADELHGHDRPPTVPPDAPDFVQRVTATMLAGNGDRLPVSAMPIDGTFPTATSQWEKRSIAAEIPIWDPDICIDCARCALVCPHAAIRMKVYEPDAATDAPAAFAHKEFKNDPAERWLTIQVAPDDCTGCGVCVDICPAKSKEAVRHKSINMMPKADHLDSERSNFDFFRSLPETDRSETALTTVKGSQQAEPLFEFSGACAGCGETPYLKLLSQLFGDRILVANATGCSSIYGGNLPTTPWSRDDQGRGPAWANSLFEDNAEFGLGMRLAYDQHRSHARSLVGDLAEELGEVADQLLDADQSTEAGLAAQRDRVELLRAGLASIDDPKAGRLADLADYLVETTVWIVGGDGWAYDIGFGGLDHVLASGRDVNVLVLDTEVYSNTGGQTSKATPRGAIAKFSAGGKTTAKKDLAMIAMAYADVYVAHIAMGANMTQTVKAFAEAESHPGPSLLIAYSPCIAHGIDMSQMMSHQKAAAESGYWPLFRYDPRREAHGEHALHLDSRKPKIPFKDFAMTEGRFAMLATANPTAADDLMELAQRDIDDRWHLYEQMVEVEHTATFGDLEDNA